MILLPRQTRVSQPQGHTELNRSSQLVDSALLAAYNWGVPGYEPVGGYGILAPAYISDAKYGRVASYSRQETASAKNLQSLPSGQPFSFAGWVKPDNADGGIDCIFSVGTETTYSKFALYLNVYGADVYFGCYGSDVRTPVSAVSAGQWAHIAVTYAGGSFGTSTVAIYVNGVSMGLTPVGTPASVTVATAPIRISGDTVSGRGIRGKLGPLLITRRALSQREIISHMDNPWQIYASPRSFVPVSVASGGGATHTNTGSLSADVATIAGTAVHKTLHATSGALASDAAVIAGIASSVTIRPSSGALASDSATIAGTAAHKALHATSGALAAGASSIAGVSAHNVPHATSGALSSGAATIAGSAAKTSAGSFASSGSLSAGDSAISGTATHKALHATSGALSADAATLSGAARIASHRTEGAIAAGPAIMAGVAVHSGRGAVVETQYSGGYVETLREKDARRKRQKRLSDEADNRRQEEQQKPVEPQEKPKKAKRIEVDRRPEQQVSLRDQIAALPVDLDAIYAVQERERLAAEQAAIEAELLAAEQERREIMWIASQVQQMIYDAYQGSDRWKAISGKLMRLSQILARR